MTTAVVLGGGGGAGRCPSFGIRSTALVPPLRHPQVVYTRAELEGVPEDFLDSHKDDDGNIVVTLKGPDLLPGPMPAPVLQRGARTLPRLHKATLAQFCPDQWAIDNEMCGFIFPQDSPLGQRLPANRRRLTANRR